MRAVVYSPQDLPFSAGRGALFWSWLSRSVFSVFRRRAACRQEGSMSPLPVVVVSEAGLKRGPPPAPHWKGSQGLQVTAARRQARAAVRRPRSSPGSASPEFRSGPPPLDSAPITLAIESSRRTEAAFLEPMIRMCRSRARPPRGREPEGPAPRDSAFAETARRVRLSGRTARSILWVSWVCRRFAISLVSERTAGRCSACAPPR